MWYLNCDEAEEATERYVAASENKEPSILTKLCNIFSPSKNEELQRQIRKKEMDDQLNVERQAAEQAKKQEMEAKQKKAVLKELTEQRRSKISKINENSSAPQQINQQGVASDGYLNQDTMNSNNFSFLQGNPVFSQMTTYNIMDPRILTNNLQQQLNAIENEMQQRQTTTQSKPKKINCQKNNTTHFGKHPPPTAYQEDKKTIQAKNNTQFRSTVFDDFEHVKNCNQQAEDRNILVIPHRNETRSIGVIGLAKSGKSFLIRALAGGLPAKELTNPVVTKNVALFELNHPNNGFISGSVKQNTPIYDSFFQKARLSNLSYLIICSYGSVREEDYLLICLTQKYHIPCIIVRTKLDEWLGNSDTDQSKEEYVFKDKQYVAGTLQNLNLDFQSKNIYNISAIAVIKSVKEHANTHMAKYAQDEQALMNVLKLSLTNIKIPINPAELDVVHSQNGVISTISNWISFSKFEMHSKKIFADNNIHQKPNISNYSSLTLLITEKELIQIRKVDHLLYFFVYHYNQPFIIFKTKLDIWLQTSLKDYFKKYCTGDEKDILNPFITKNYLKL